MNAFHNPTQYLINSRFESTMSKLENIQQYIVSLVDRILKVISDINLRLSYVMNLVLRLSENPVHPSRDTNKTPIPKQD